MASLTPEGLVTQSFDEIQAATELDLIERFKALGFDSIDLTPSSVFGQFVGIRSEALSDIEALALAIYFSQYPDFASNLSLDLACELTRTRRIPATRTEAPSVVYGLDGTVLLALSQAADAETGNVYQIDNQVTISKAAAVYARLQIGTVANGAYTVTIDSVDYTFTASSNTEAEILTGLEGAITGLDVVNLDGELILTKATPFNFTVTSNILIAEVGTQATFYAVEAGNKSLPANALTQVATPVAGWNRVNNLVAATTGRNRENDEALRIRRARAVDNSLLGALEQLENVTDARVKENDGTATDSDGTPRQTIWAIVEGGDNTDIAETIIQFKPAGIGTRGTVTVNTESPFSGETTAVKFDRPTYLEPLIDVEYTITDAALFPPDGEDLIKQALVNYGATLRIGQTLFYSRLFTPINTVPGMEVTILVAEDGLDTPAVQNIVAATNEKVRLLLGNITVAEATP